MKKHIKKILHNCPYMTALFATWFFLTAGGIGLMIYRDYGRPDWKMFWEHPFFAMMIEEEIHGGMESNAKVEAAMSPIDGRADSVQGQDADKTTRVILNVERDKEESIGGRIIEGLLEVSDGISAEEAQITLPEIRDNDRENPAAERLTQEQMQETEAPLPEEIHEEFYNGETGAETDGRQPDTQVQTIVGRTVFMTYTPVETHSVYYTDAGEVALTTEYPYVTVEDDYFEDAAFIGDSRTLGISDYAGLGADFYCENGMTIYKMLDEKGINYQKTGEKVNLGQILQQKKYGKIYIMLGMNELGYRDTNFFMEKYRTVLEQIREWQPESIIYIMGNLHVSEQKNNNETEFNNININDKNAAIASLADGIHTFYLDSNPLFTDDRGFLRSELTFDGVHLYADNYPVWKTFLMEHGVIRNDEGE